MSGNGLSSRLRQFLHPRETREGQQSPFQRLAQQMQDVLGDGGVLKEVVQPGDGPPVPGDASVSFHFSGFLEYCDSPFDTTNHLKYPRWFKIGRDTTLPGLVLGLLTMKKGEHSLFLLRPQYAFGEMGCPPLIPPAASVLYEVQLLDFLDSAEASLLDFLDSHPFFALSPEQQNSVSLSSLLSVVDMERSFGNQCFNQSRFHDAKNRYKQAVTLLGNWQAADEEEERRVREMQLPVLLNLSLVHLRLARPGRALDYSLRALELCSTSTKALFRCGQAYLDMNDYEKARDYLTMAQANKPFDIDINKSLRKLAIRFLDQEKEMLTKMFADSPTVSNTRNKEASAAPQTQEENICRICMDAPIDCVLLECGHMVTCSKCGKRMSECPICRQYVVRAVHVFRS